MSTIKKINNKNVVKESESVSSYLTCISNEDENESMAQYNKIQTVTRKSRLYIKDLFYESDTLNNSKSNRGRLKSTINNEPSSHTMSTKTLCVVSQKRKKFGKAMMDRHSEELPPTKYSSRTSCYNTKRYFSTTSFAKPYRKKDQFIVRAVTQCTTVLESSHQQIGRPLQGSKEATSLTNEYFNDFRGNCSNRFDDRKAHAYQSFEDAGVPRRDNENHSLAMSLKLKTIINADVYSETDEETQYLRNKCTNNALGKLNSGKSHPSVHEFEIGSNSNTMNEMHQSESIDYKFMQRCLRKSTSAIKKFDILQSLLLRLASQDSSQRLATVQAIISHDLFSIKQNSGCEIVIKNLLWPLNVRTPHPLQTSTAKLINALVSYQIGREYFDQMSMVYLLTWNIDTELISDSMKDNLMAVMMKLSLSPFHRCDMLENGILQWLINHMEKVEFTASTFHLECMTDLLRMLLDVENVVELSLVKIPQIIIVLVRYMNVENEYVKINVCHALRAFLRNRTAIKIGNKIHLHRIIQDHIQRASNSTLKENLKFIYKLFMSYRMYESNKQEPPSVRNRDCKDYNKHEIHSESKVNMKYYSKPEVRTKNDEESLKHVRENQLSVSESCHPELAQRSENFDQELLADISSCILQMCLNKKMENSKSLKKKSNVTNSETEDYSTDDSFGSVSIKSESAESDAILVAKNKGDQPIVNDDELPKADVVYTNVNWKIDQNSSLLHSNSRIYSQKVRPDASENAIGSKGIKSVNMEDLNQNGSSKSTSQLKKSKPSNMKTKSIDFSDFNSIAKDPNVRKEILENDSFIEELCEKVLEKLRPKLFCGPNCYTNKCCEKKSDEVEKI